ncbi:hypothetical protein PJL18_03257 [Paenarthrobacter nicotinovorans]|nr:hypothetical protein [Paenarthrobacter nicotinovorans]
MVDCLDRTRSTICSSTCGQIDACGCSPDAGPESNAPAAPCRSDMSSTGTVTVRFQFFFDGGATISTGAWPARNWATNSRGWTVAESPMRCAGLGSNASRRSRETARCAPRLVPATACTSSMMMVSTSLSVSRARDVSMRNRDSGVVMRMSGGLVSSVRRSAAVVSPERTPTVTSGAGNPKRLAVCVMPISGDRRFRSTSTPSALSGEI